MSKALSAGRTSPLLLAALIGAISLAACSSDKIVYRDRQPFNQPLAAAAGFLGYYDTVTKQTTCGNCHADFQGKWSQTKHARAWADLQANAGKAASCEGCHSVTGNGNAAVGTPVGYAGVKSAAYTDVQCES
ncbi:MAG TPA: multiheme c-type cytochrome, partial [Gemmatimonadaceae bacterium]|nr:multiheme c-type cytochrome [Gemmatimonadaceae bacterium]